MKTFIRNIKFIIPVLVLVLISESCKDEDYLTGGLPFSVEGTVVAVSGVSGEYNTALPDDGVTYTLDVGGADPGSVNVFVSHNGGTPGALTSVSSFPSTEFVSLAAAAAGANVPLANVAPGDNFKFTFELGNGYNTTESFSADVFIVFKSALDGTFNSVTTLTNQNAGIGWDGCEGQTWEGMVEWERAHTDPNGDGSYIVYSFDSTGAKNEDMSHGAYYPCYNADAAGMPLGDLRVSDVDGKLSIPGASQWGEVYTVKDVAVDGNVLTFGWTNDYGEGAVVQLTRTDGEDWPENLR